MADGRADLAVHSLKDVPMDMPDGLHARGIAAREDPRDAFVSNRYHELAALPDGARVGTSSLRREAQLRERFPLLVDRAAARQRQHAAAQARRRAVRRDHPRRGRIEAARLRRPHRGAARARRQPAGARAGRARDRMPRRSRRRRRRARAARRRDTTLATTAERAFSRALSGSCHTPLAAYAEWEEGELWLRGLLASARRPRSAARRARAASRGRTRGAADALGRGWRDDFSRADSPAAAAARRGIHSLEPRRDAPGPLAGVGVLVTRPVRQAAGLVRRLAALGATPIAWPAIVILPPADPAPLARVQAASRRTTSRCSCRPTPSNSASATRRWPASLVRSRRARAPPRRSRRSACRRARARGALRLRRIAGAARTAGREGQARRSSSAVTAVASCSATRCASAARTSTTWRAIGAPRRRSARRASCARFATAAWTPSPSRRPKVSTICWAVGDAGRASLAKLPVFVPHPRIAEHARDAGPDRDRHRGQRRGARRRIARMVRFPSDHDKG